MTLLFFNQKVWRPVSVFTPSATNSAPARDHQRNAFFGGHGQGKTAPANDGSVPPQTSVSGHQGAVGVPGQQMCEKSHVTTLKSKVPELKSQPSLIGPRQATLPGVVPSPAGATTRQPTAAVASNNSGPTSAARNILTTPRTSPSPDASAKEKRSARVGTIFV